VKVGAVIAVRGDEARELGRGEENITWRGREAGCCSAEARCGADGCAGAGEGGASANQQAGGVKSFGGGKSYHLTVWSSRRSCG